MNKHGDPRSVPTLVVGAISGLLLLLAIFLLQVFYYKAERVEVNAKRGDIAAEFRMLRDMQAADLEMGYYWLDRENGIVALPIERAMERVIERAEKADEGS